VPDRSIMCLWSRTHYKKSIKYMANNLGINLKDKKVIARGKVFECKDGFGCSPETSGSKIFGNWEGEPVEKDRNGIDIWDVISGYEVKGIVVE